MNAPDPKANTTTEAYLAYKAGYLEESELKPVLYEPYLHFDAWLAYWAGLTNEYPLDKNGDPEMLTDEEALVAYLSGVTNTYPEEIKDPYDVRIVGYLKYLVSARFGRPEYPVNNQEFYLSTMKPPVVPSGDTPATNIELDGTAEAPFIDLKMFGDTFQETYSGKNLFNKEDPSWLPGYFESGEIINGVTARNIVFYIPCLPNTTYSIRRVTGDLWGGGFIIATTSTTPAIGVSVSRPLDIGRGETYSGYTTNSDATFLVLRAQTEIGYTWEDIDPNTQLNLWQTFINNLQIEQNSTATTYEPYVGGVPSPNPDYPQPISVVTGRQEVDVIGDGTNLFDAFNENSGNIVVLEDGTMEVSGISSSNGYCSLNRKLSQLIPSVKVGDVVYLYLETDFSARQYVYSDGDKTNWYSGQSRTVTQEMLDNGFVVYGGYQTTNHIRVMMSKSQASEYVPYSGKPYEINLGKNLVGLVDKAETTENGLTYSIEDGIVTVDGTATNTTYLEITDMFSLGDTPSDFVLSLTPISGEVSFCIIGLSSRNANDGQVQWHQVNTNLTPSVKEYSSSVLSSIKTIKPYINKNSSFNNFKFKLQLERGSEATSYASYFKPIELCKVGDYQDRIYRNENGGWVLRKETRKVVLNGSEDSWETISVGDAGNKRFGYNLTPVFSVDSTKSLAVSNKFIGVPSQRTKAVVNSVCVWGNNLSNLLIFATDNSGITLEQFKTQLASSHVTVYFYGGEPTEEVLYGELADQLDTLFEGGSYEGKTYIEITATDPNLPAGLIVEAGKYA